MLRRIRAIEEALDAWRREKCSSLCPGCPDCCCNGRLNPRLDRLDAFKALPAVRWRWERAPVEGAYIVDRRVLFGGSRFLAGVCPHYVSGGCAIFGRPGRPLDCRLYPVSLQRPFWGLPFGVMIGAELSCHIFDDGDNKKSLEELARTHDVELVFFPKGAGGA